MGHGRSCCSRRLANNPDGVASGGSGHPEGVQPSSLQSRCRIGRGLSASLSRPMFDRL